MANVNSKTTFLHWFRLKLLICRNCDFVLIHVLQEASKTKFDSLNKIFENFNFPCMTTKKSYNSYMT